MTGDSEKLDELARDMAAVRSFAYRGARAVAGEDAAEEMEFRDRLATVLDRLESVEEEVESMVEYVYLRGLLENDEPVKRARKLEILEHLIDKAKQKSSGKSQVATDTAATLSDVSRRQVRAYFDEMADEVPGIHTETSEGVGGSKTLRIDLGRFKDASPDVEVGA